MGPSNFELLITYDQAFEGRSWHGTPWWGSLRGLAPDAALRRPAPGRHNIWELVLHCAYWKFVAYRCRVTVPSSPLPLILSSPPPLFPSSPHHLPSVILNPSGSVTPNSRAPQS